MDDLTFIINPEIDKIVREKCPIPNWGDSLLNWMTPKLREKYYKLLEKSYDKPFLNFVNGVKFEYGIDCEQNIEKALEFYNLAADQYDSCALYKLYTIHHSENEKFKIKRNKNFEIYYLLKAMAYSDCAVVFNQDTLYNTDILYEIAIILDQDDIGLDKTNRLFMDMKGIIKSEEELRFVEAVTLLKFNATDEDVILGLEILKDLADNHNYIEAIYKLAVSFGNQKCPNQNNSDLATKYFKILEEKEFYKSLSDYGQILYNLKDYENSKETLRIGCEKGNIRCYFLYYDVFLFSYDFSQANHIELTKILDLLLNDIINGNVFSLFEYFYTRKIIRKHFNLKDYEGIAEHNVYSEELIEILKNFYKDKNKIENVWIKGIAETEFLLTYGFINYIQKEGLEDVDLGEKLLKDSFHLSNNDSYKRFCYSLIFKIRMKNYKNIKEDSENTIETTKIKIYKIYTEAKGELDDFSSSFYYFLARIYENGWGTKVDELFSYCYYYHASIAMTKYLGTGSMISYYRKFKAENKLKLEKFVKIEKDLEKYKEDQINKDSEDSFCCICFENIVDVIYYPCKHMTCTFCFDKLKSSNKCPQCRGKIILFK